MAYSLTISQEFFEQYLSKAEQDLLKAEQEKIETLKIEDNLECDIYLKREENDNEKGILRKVLIKVMDLLVKYKFKIHINNSNISITFNKTKGLFKKDIFSNISNNDIKNVEFMYNKLKSKIVYNFLISLDYSPSYENEEQVMINTLQFFLLDKIVVLNEAEMFHLNSLSYKQKIVDFDVDWINELRPDDIKSSVVNVRKVDLMGCYLKKTDEQDRNFIELIKMKQDLPIEDLDHVICLCFNNMNFFMQQRAFKKESKFQLYEKVLSHEIGHMIFSYLDIKSDSNEKIKFKERQANYFSSYIFSSDLDRFIKKVTKYQNSDYHNPLLLSHKLNTPNYDELVKNFYKGKM